MSFNTVAAAALVALAINPADLFRAGPQLSFLAVAALVWRREWAAGEARRDDPLERLIAHSRGWRRRMFDRAVAKARAAMVASAVVWIAVSPLIVAQFHLLSASSILIGPLVALPVSLGMGSGFVLLATGGWAPPLAAPSAAVCEGCLRLVETVVGWGARLPGGHLWLPGPSGWWLAGFYLGLAAWAGAALWQRGHWPVRWLVGLFCAWLCVGLGASWAGRHAQPAALRCTNLAVGHGTAVVLELPDGRTLLYDAGHLGAPLPASNAVAGYLWSRGVTHLDAVVLSHADADHYNGIPALARQFSIGVVYVSPQMFETMTAGLALLQRALAEQGVRVEEVWAPERLAGGPGTTIEIIHPSRRGLLLASDNANSIVLAVEHAGRRLLLTGDLESPGLEAVLAEEPWDCDVLVAPHHGSLHSAPQTIAAWCRPEWTIISGADRDQHPAVDAAYAAHGEVWHTAREGAVQAILSRQGVEIRSWRRELAAGRQAF
jgi:competence protein ComEC